MIFQFMKKRQILEGKFSRVVKWERALKLMFCNHADTFAKAIYHRIEDLTLTEGIRSKVRTAAKAEWTRTKLAINFGQMAIHDFMGISKILLRLTKHLEYDPKNITFGEI
jgi:hypothetical protein